jgi:hypothetical protein
MRGHRISVAQTYRQMSDQGNSFLQCTKAVNCGVTVAETLVERSRCAADLSRVVRLLQQALS